MKENNLPTIVENWISWHDRHSQGLLRKLAQSYFESGSDVTVVIDRLRAEMTMLEHFEYVRRDVETEFDWENASLARLIRWCIENDCRMPQKGVREALRAEEYGKGLMTAIERACREYSKRDSE